MVACRDDKAVYVYDVATHREKARIEVGNGPYGLAVSKSRPLAVAGNQSDGTVSVIDIQTGSVTHTVGTGSLPVFMAILD